MQGGIDEAGRGPVLGPLVVAGVAAQDASIFGEMGCTDSKLLSPDRRQALERALRRSPEVRIELRAIAADEIDAERREGRGLNAIEARRFRDIARSLGATEIWVDAADVDAKRFGRHVRAGLPAGIRIVSEHKADLTYPVVGAASIVAKVERDRAIAKLARRLERKAGVPMGSGYASDPLTQAFLRTWWETYGELPEGTRTTWATAKELVAPRQAALDAYVGAPAVVHKP